MKWRIIIDNFERLVTSIETLIVKKEKYKFTSPIDDFVKHNYSNYNLN